MKLKVNGKALASAVSRATGAITRVKANPYLMTVRMEANGDELEIAATDLDRAISIRIACAGELAAVCLDFTRLAGILAPLKDRGDVTIERGDQQVIIAAGRSRFTMPFLKPDTWPTLLEPNWDFEFDAPGDKFARLMTALAPAISDEASRIYLNGIHLERGAIRDARQTGQLVAVATDGHKLYARELPVTDMPKLPDIIIPASSCASIARLFGESEMIHVRGTDRKLHLSAGDTSYLTKLVEGIFPDWRRVTPQRGPGYSYDTARLIGAATAVAAAKIAEKGGKLVRLTFGDDETEIDGRDSNDPNFTGFDAVPHSMLCDAPTSPIGMNVDYLIEMATQLEAETIEIAPGDGSGPVVLRSPTHSDRVICVMPMRI